MTRTYEPARQLGGHQYTLPGSQPEPAEIVARVRARFARQSPENALLVRRAEAAEAEKQALLAARVAARDPQQPRPRRNASRERRQERVRQYAGLRDRGVSHADAAAQVGVRRSAARYYRDEYAAGSAS